MTRPKSDSILSSEPNIEISNLILELKCFNDDASNNRRRIDRSGSIDLSAITCDFEVNGKLNHRTDDRSRRVSESHGSANGWLYYKSVRVCMRSRDRDELFLSMLCGTLATFHNVKILILIAFLVWMGFPFTRSSVRSFVLSDNACLSLVDPLKQPWLIKFSNVGLILIYALLPFQGLGLVAQ